MGSLFYLFSEDSDAFEQGHVPCAGDEEFQCVRLRIQLTDFLVSDGGVVIKTLDKVMPQILDKGKGGDALTLGNILAQLGIGDFLFFAEMDVVESLGLGKRRDVHLGAAHQILVLGESILNPASELMQALNVVRMEPAVWHRRDIQIQAGISAHGIEIYVLEVFQRMRRLLRMEKPAGTMEVSTSAGAKAGFLE